jgi:hypothetical protein
LPVYITCPLTNQMFYATGSIYEDPNMGDWGSGTPPDVQQAPPSASAGSPEAGSTGSSAAGDQLQGPSSTLGLTASDTGTPIGSAASSSSTSVPASSGTGASQSTAPTNTSSPTDGADESAARMSAHGASWASVAAAVAAWFLAGLFVA